MTHAKRVLVWVQAVFDVLLLIPHMHELIAMGRHLL